MSIPKWITDAAEKAPQISTKGYQVSNGPSINFDDPLYAELYSKYITGQLDEADATAIDEIEFLRGVANQATAKLLSTMQNKLSADKKKEEKPEAKEPAPEAPAKNEKEDPTPKLDTGRGEGKLPEPSVSKWKECRWNERLECFQGITTERSVMNFNSEEEALNYLKDS